MSWIARMRSTCVDLRWVAKWRKTCVDLRVRLARALLSIPVLSLCSTYLSVWCSSFLQIPDSGNKEYHFLRPSTLLAFLSRNPQLYGHRDGQEPIRFQHFINHVRRSVHKVQHASIGWCCWHKAMSSHVVISKRCAHVCNWRHVMFTCWMTLGWMSSRSQSDTGLPPVAYSTLWRKTEITKTENLGGGNWTTVNSSLTYRRSLWFVVLSGKPFFTMMRSS